MPRRLAACSFFFVAAGSTMVRVASVNGRAVKCKSVFEHRRLFVLFEQMNVGGQPKVNVST